MGFSCPLSGELPVDDPPDDDFKPIGNKPKKPEATAIPKPDLVPIPDAIGVPEPVIVPVPAKVPGKQPVPGPVPAPIPFPVPEPNPVPLRPAATERAAFEEHQRALAREFRVTYNQEAKDWRAIETRLNREAKAVQAPNAVPYQASAGQAPPGAVAENRSTAYAEASLAEAYRRRASKNRRLPQPVDAGERATAPPRIVPPRQKVRQPKNRKTAPKQVKQPVRAVIVAAIVAGTTLIVNEVRRRNKRGGGGRPPSSPAGAGYNQKAVITSRAPRLAYKFTKDTRRLQKARSTAFRNRRSTN